MNYMGQFSFVSAHGRLLQAYTNGEMHASQEVDKVGEEERWNVYAWSDGQVSLQNYRTNRFLAAEPDGKAICDRPNPDAFEKWKLHAVENRVAFLGHHNMWLCGQPPKQDTKWGGEVCANRKSPAEWERWSMIPSEGIPLRNQNWWETVCKVMEIAKEIVPVVATIV